MDKTIDIFYIATGVYTTYFDNFLCTVHNFLPSYNKRIHVISDGLKEYNGYNENGISINVIFQMDLPYPIIPLLKSKFISYNLTDDMKYVFYFDADTIFLEKDDEYWEIFIKDIDNGNFLLSNHPGNYYRTYSIPDTSKAFIAPGFFYYTIISSFYGGSIDGMKKICEKELSMISSDLTSHVNGHQSHYIPPLFDQDYVNKIADESNDMSFSIKYFVNIHWFSNSQDRHEENFIEQKYDIQRKFETKNML